LPFGSAAVALIGAYLTDRPSQGSRHSIDYPGVATLAASVACLLLALIQVGKRGSFAEPDLLVLFFLSAVLLAVFIYLQRRAAEPLLPVSLFRNRVFTVCAAVGFFSGMGLFGSISFIPLFVQGVLFGSATRAGSALTPLMLTWVFLSIISGRLMLKTGYRPVVISGMVLFAGGFLWLSRLGPASTYGDILPAMSLLGAGMGLSMVTILLAVQNTVPRKLMGTATSANLFFRTIGGAVGVAIMGSVMGHRMVGHLAGSTDPEFVRLATNPDTVVNEAARQALSPAVLEWLRMALGDSLHAVFVTGTVIAALAFLVSFAFPRGSAQELASRR
ncbi:MAG: MFS transporter, partial [Acidobacteriota bacterium]